MQVELITMAQEMDLSDGSMAHFLVLKLSSGVLVKALVSSESAQAVVFAKVSGEAPPPTTSVDLATSDSVVRMGDTVAMIFGGDIPPTPASPAPASAPPSEEPPKPRRKAARVEKDAWGYPILANGGIDPGEIVGGRDQDEDGIGQG